MWHKLGRAFGFIAVSALVATLITRTEQIQAAQPNSMNQGITPPNMSAKSAFVINATTGEVLYEKNPDEIFRTLSLTKLVTAYILVDRMGDQLSATIEIARAHLTGGSSANLKRGDVWTLQDLLYGMVLVSGNDASLAIADAVGRELLAAEGEPGDTAMATKRFVAEMGSTAKDLGARNASFADPYGLSPNNAATARDMGLIAAKIFTDARLLPAWAFTERTLHIEGKQPRAVALKTSLEILGDETVIGAKTGSYASKRIFNLVSAWRAANGQTIVGVVMGSKSNAARYAEMRAIIKTAPNDFRELRGAEVAAAQSPTVACN